MCWTAGEGVGHSISPPVIEARCTLPQSVALQLNRSASPTQRQGASCNTMYLVQCVRLQSEWTPQVYSL